MILMCQIHVFELHRYRRSQGSSTFYAWIFRTFLACKHFSNAKNFGDHTLRYYLMYGQENDAKTTRIKSKKQFEADKQLKHDQ